MINFVPEDIKPKEELKPESKQSEPEIEMVQPIKIEKKTSPSVSPSGSQSNQLINPWLGSDINLDQELSASAVKVGAGGLFESERPTAISGKGRKPLIGLKISIKDTKFFKTLLKIKAWLVKLVIILGPQRLPGEKPRVYHKQGDLTKSETGVQGGIEITLMPEEVPITKRMIYERVLVLLAVMAFLFLVLFLGWTWVNWRCELARIRISQIKSEMVAAESKISGYQDLIKNIKILEKQTARARNLLENHLYWTKFFKFLETYTVPDIYYPSFSAKPSGVISLPAVGRNLLSVARQLAAFYGATDFVEDVKAINVNATPKGATFNLQLKLKDTLLIKK